MNPHAPDLLARIEVFEIDDPTSPPKGLSFADRLARENGWTPEFAGRVIKEYKRFVFLCMEAGHPCTPSEQVDQAWHLHLVYTRSYWTRMCEQVLRRPLHHGPTVGGTAERSKFNDWYSKTKSSYELLIGSPPPPDIWPPHKKRFGNDIKWERVNTASNWVIPKPRRAHALTLLGAVSLLTLAGCTTLGASTDVIVLIVLLALLGIGLLILTLKLRKGGSRGDSGGGFIGGFFDFGGDSGSDSGGDSGCGGGCGGCGG